MTRNDRAALKLALALARNESPARAQQIDSMLEDQPWEGVAQFAASCCQSRSLNLDPWQEPPCWGNSDAGRPGRKEADGANAGCWCLEISSRPDGGAGRGEEEKSGTET